jgi:hypothetical protein
MMEQLSQGSVTTSSIYRGPVRKLLYRSVFFNSVAFAVFCGTYSITAVDPPSVFYFQLAN